MKSARKEAKAWLKHALLSEFKEVLQEAKLTPRQLDILNMRHLQGLYNYQIARALSISPETVRDEVAAAHDQIGLAIKEFRWKNILTFF